LQRLILEEEVAMEDLPKHLISRAIKPPLEFGWHRLSEASRSWGNYLLVTMHEPWESARSLVDSQPAHVHFVNSMNREEIEQVEAKLPNADTIVGLGGGMAMDMAKYLAWRRKKDPVLIPSIASVDACVTNTIAVREFGKVRYVGFVVPQVVLTDFALVLEAPSHLNRAGIGDILSIHTALWDWRVASDRGLSVYDEKVAQEVADLVAQLEVRSSSIQRVDETAIQWLIEAYAAENALCLQVGHSRPEEGSEHFFAYNVEHRTGQHYVHGELVALGILLMSRLQDNQPERIESILDATGIRFQPYHLDLSQADLQGALLTLEAYVRNEGLPHSVIDERAMNEAMVEELCRDLVF
jgi:glycerol dehydrogenase-like iron-containing ADH family enzyme